MYRPEEQSKHGQSDAYRMTEELFANITYYKLRAEKHFGYYIIGMGKKATELAALKKSSIRCSCPQGAP